MTVLGNGKKKKRKKCKKQFAYSNVILQAQ